MRAMTILLGLLAGATADVYMQYPPGGNNRLDEGGGNRNNNNRLMDTQNNAKGGYGYGGDKDNQADNLKYMVGSELSIEWTSQHSCGSANNECHIIIQAMCNSDTAGNTPAGYVVGTSYCSNDDQNNQADCTAAGNQWVVVPGVGEGPLRDGTDDTSPDPDAPDANTGLHEPASFYKDCKARERNKGLYTADQNINNNKGATATRQNPGGNDSGQECPEERDYYPYWHPAGWFDVAIMTNDLARCEFYQSESQNVKAKNYCTNPKLNNEADCIADCTTPDAECWLEVPAHGIPAPECLSAPEQRDNHLGNVQTAHTSATCGPDTSSAPVVGNVVYKWTVPYGLGVKSCSDKTIINEADCVAPAVWEGADDATNCVLRLRYNITTADTMTCSIGDLVTKETCLAQNATWSNAYTNASYNALVKGNGKAENGDLGLNANGNQNPGLLKQNPDVDMGGFLTDTGGTDSLLELAVNTNQYGRTFQDRSHTFTVQSRPPQIGKATQIYNLNVRGKRGNIVQTYPATEYDFAPVKLNVGYADMVHIQWTGNDDTNNNGNNNGEGTNSEDRHNIVQLAYSGKAAPKSYAQGSMFDVDWEWNPDTSGEFGGARDEETLTMQAALAKQTGCLTQDGINNGGNKDQDRQNCQKLNAASATMDLGLMKFKPGEYKYMSSRNNNFSNRAQKATLCVTDLPSVPPDAPENLKVETIESGNENVGALRVTWTKPGTVDNRIGFDGVEYPNTAQPNVDVIDYKVSYSTDGGETWVSAGSKCSGTIYECVISGLPAGTTVGVVVQAGGAAGYGPYSTEVFGETQESQTSRECESTLRAQAEGSYISPGTIVAISFGVVAFFLLVGGGFYLAKRRQPPPPPGGVHNPGKAGY